MNWIQIYIMWGGIIAILLRAIPRLIGEHVEGFWEYSLVVTLLTAGLIFTVGTVTQRRGWRR